MPLIWNLGMAQSSAAAQTLYRRLTSGAKRGTKRRRKAKATTRRAPRRKASSRKPARLVKGSKAAKAYMAKIRRKRK